MPENPAAVRDGEAGLAAIAARAAPHGLAQLGAFHPFPGDGVPGEAGTLVLLGPSGPAFWEAFRHSGEVRDRLPDPLDRWSARVIGALARALGGSALFPFGGPPHLPFPAWALRSGRTWTSPVGLLVHEREGLMVSFRGAIALPARLPIPGPGPCPCTGCPAPCLVVCPAGALDGTGYDVPACRAFLSGPAGRDCMDLGCAVRRACPVSPARAPEQSGFHMAAFRGRA